MTDPVDPDEIIRAVLEDTGVSIAMLLSNKRRGSLPFARSLICYILHEKMGYSYPECSMRTNASYTLHSSCVDAVGRLIAGRHDEQAAVIDPALKSAVEYANKIYEKLRRVV